MRWNKPQAPLDQEWTEITSNRSHKDYWLPISYGQPTYKCFVELNNEIVFEISAVEEQS